MSHFIIQSIISILIICLDIYFDSIKADNNNISEILYVIGAILVIAFQTLFISNIIQRCNAMKYSNLLLIVSILLYILNEIYKIFGRIEISMLYLIIGMLPNRKNE